MENFILEFQVKNTQNETSVAFLSNIIVVEDVMRFQEESGSHSIWKGFFVLQSRLNRSSRIRVFYLFTRLCEFDSFHPKNNLLRIKYLS